MPDHKQLCKTCKTRHVPPMGKKCKLQKKQIPAESDNELFSDAAIAGQVPATQNKQEVSGDGQLLQMQILQQLKKVTERLDHVEQRMDAAPGKSSSPELSSDSFLENIKPSKKQKKTHVVTDSSSDESDCPSLEMLKSHLLQKKVDKRLRDLNQSSHEQGKEKIKSMRGGSIDIQVKHKVHWPHEAIWGGSHSNG